ASDGNLCFGVFFFSSRRRHTRFSRDWSSDVCSSDLRQVVLQAGDERCADEGPRQRAETADYHHQEELDGQQQVETLRRQVADQQIGRASCRERVWVSLVAY